MGAAASKKRKRRREEADAAGSAAPAEAAPAPPPAPFVPPKVLTVALLALALGGAGYFVSEGLATARGAEGALASKLLNVVSKNETPPSFDLPGYDGKKMGLADVQGKVVFLNFWATWCPPCVEEMPSMKRLQARMADDPNFSMVTISTDEEWAEVRQFFEGDAPPFPVLLDPGGDLAKRYGTEKFPETYVLVDGRLVGHIVGPRDWDHWYAEAYLRGLLKGS